MKRPWEITNARKHTPCSCQVYLWLSPGSSTLCLDLTPDHQAVTHHPLLICQSEEETIIWNDNSPTAIQSIIHLHLDSGDRISEFVQRDQRSSLRSHWCKHLVLKFETGFVARNFLKVFEKALLDEITFQLPLLFWNQSEVLGHECISILSEPNIWWMEHPLGHCPAHLSEFNVSWIMFLGRTWECCKSLWRSFMLLRVSDCFNGVHPQQRVGCVTFLPWSRKEEGSCSIVMNLKWVTLHYTHPHCTLVRLRGSSPVYLCYQNEEGQVDRWQWGGKWKLNIRGLWHHNSI